MPRQFGQKVVNQFVKGLITEATGMNFPEDAAIESWNCRFNEKGIVSRRLGYSFENNDINVLESGGTFSFGVVRSFIWRGVAENGDLNFLVVQTGNSLSFFKPDVSGFFSTGLKSFSINLRDYRASGATGNIQNYLASLDYGNGKLFVNHPLCEPIYVKYDLDTDTISVTQYEILIRDFKGLVESPVVEYDLRPDSLSTKHKYNLYNQGWYPRKVDCAGGLYNPLDYWDLYKSFADNKYPSNADIWWIYKNINDELSYGAFNKHKLGNTPAPKGYYIDNAFYFDRSNVSGIPGFAVETSSGSRPSCVAFFAGRIWYAGVNTEDYSGNIYYTQIIERDEQIGRCHQLNDPTSEEASDLLDTDGGVVKITGISKATLLLVVRNSLFIFAENGIWAISGGAGAGAGFTATDFKVEKVSDNGLHQLNSLVNANGVPLWWNKDGIWTLKASEFNYEAVNLSNTTIKSFFLKEIPEQSRIDAQGAYNSISNTIQWVFKSTAGTGFVNRYKYDRILELNLTSGAFYPMKWSVSDFCISGIFPTDHVSGTLPSSEIVTTIAGVTITDSALLDITIDTSSSGSISNAPYFKYPSVNDNILSFIQEADTSYTDVATLYAGVGKAIDSYFITGAKISGSGDKRFNPEYITVFANTGTGYSCKIQGRWDWTNISSTGKWSVKQEVYSTRVGRDVSRRRLLMRGTGPALQLKFESVAGKGFEIIGWTTLESVDVLP